MSGKREKPVLPVKGETRLMPFGRSGVGPVVCMAAVDGWIMARRPGACPMTIYWRDWQALPLATCETTATDPGLGQGSRAENGQGEEVRA